MDIPPFKEFNCKTPIEIRTNSGIVHFFPIRGIRAIEENKFMISLEGALSQPVKLRERCYMSFKGYQLGAHFSHCGPTRDGAWIATLEAIIPIAEFWQDGNPPEQPRVSN